MSMRTSLEPPVLTTSRLTIRMCKPSEAERVMSFFTENADHLQPWWPTFHAEQFTAGFWRSTLHHYDQDFRNGRAVKMFLFDYSENVVGIVNLNQLVRGVSHSAILGYGIARDCEGKGLMTEAVMEVVKYAFGPLYLHRLTANYIPVNVASGRILEKVGFVKEGYAKDYLLINGQWRDHVLTGLNNSDWTSL